MAFFFPDNPGCDTERLRLDVKEALRRFIPRRTMDITIGTVETTIAHGLGRPPTSIIVVPQGDCRWWKSKESDDKNIYLQASAETMATIEVSEA